MTSSGLRVHRRETASLEEFDEGDPLAWILGFDTSRDFVNDVLSRQALHCEDPREERFKELLSTEALDSILGTFGLRRPEIRLVRFDRDVGPSEYEWRGLVDPIRVGRLFAEGATVIFGALHDRHEPLRRLCAAFSSQAGARTQTNIYLTPPRSRGFKPHWDTHDVFVLQVEGSKLWRIYGGGPDTPLASQKFDPDLHEPGAVEAEFTLSAGDVLYIPRGVMHAAETRDDASLHITLGLIAYSWSELIGECLGVLALGSERWRENLPFGFGRQADTGFAEIKKGLRERLKAAVDELDVASTATAKLDEIGNAFRPRVSGYLTQPTLAESVSEGDVVQHRSDLHGRMEVREDRVVVISAGHELDFPVVAERTVAAVLRGEPVLVGEIDDGLDWAGRKVVLSTMLREGLVVRTEAGSR